MTAATGHDGFLHAFSEAWLAAWNSHETDQVLELLSSDVTWDDRTFWPEVIHGREGVRTYVDAIWRAMPNVKFSEIGRFFDPEATRGIVLFRQWGGPPARFAGNPGFDAHGCDVFLSFQDDLLSHYLSSYDMVGMLGQMRLLPDREQRLGGSYLMSLAH